MSTPARSQLGSPHRALVHVLAHLGCPELAADLPDLRWAPHPFRDDEFQVHLAGCPRLPRRSFPRHPDHAFAAGLHLDRFDDAGCCTCATPRTPLPAWAEPLLRLTPQLDSLDRALRGMESVLSYQDALVIARKWVSASELITEAEHSCARLPHDLPARLRTRLTSRLAVCSTRLEAIRLELPARFVPAALVEERAERPPGFDDVPTAPAETLDPDAVCCDLDPTGVRTADPLLQTLLDRELAAWELVLPGRIALLASSAGLVLLDAPVESFCVKSSPELSPVPVGLGALRDAPGELAARLEVAAALAAPIAEAWPLALAALALS